MKFENLPSLFESKLPEIIRQIAAQNNIQPFVDNPDFFEKRLEKWHQFGLLTHTKKVREAFLKELPLFLKNLNFYEQVEEALSQEIDGVRKKILLELSIILHDLGKIILYEDTRKDREHEIVSSQLIYQSFLKNKLIDSGLTENQIKYIADCISLHDVLGKQLRDELKHSGKLNLDFLSTSEAEELCKILAKKYDNMNLEIGIYFLCDSLGKTDVRISALTDKGIIQKEQEVMDNLKKRNLSVELKHAVMQLPVNLKLAGIYLKALYPK